MTAHHWLPGVALAAISLTGTQRLPVRVLSAPEAEFVTPFSEVRGVRELSDGRLVVLDFRERILRLVDMGAGTARQIGRHGSGPGEYQLPLGIMPLPADSAAVHDMASSGRLVIFTPQGASDASLAAAPTQEGAAWITTRSRSDAPGRVYSVNRATSSDSSGIERWDRSSGRREIVAYVSPYAITSSDAARRGGRSGGSAAGSARSGGGGGRARAGGTPPFMTADQWAVASDGRVAVVSVYPYRVTFTEVDGRRWTAEPIRTEPVRVTEAHKKLWRESRRQPVASLTFSASGETVAGFSQREVAEPSAWPETLPPFLMDALAFAPNGILWVLRTSAADAPATFDLIDTAGRISARVALPPRARLVGFGAKSVYIVRRDNDDLEYLQRHPLPEPR